MTLLNPFSCTLPSYVPADYTQLRQWQQGYDAQLQPNVLLNSTMHCRAGHLYITQPSMDSFGKLVQF